MKKLYKYIVLFIGIAVFCACTDENDFLNVVEEGNDVTLKLSVQTQANKNIVVSRATAEENKLYDLHFYVFNEDGKLTGYEKLVSETGEIPSPGPEDIKIRTKTGTSYIYAVANINRGDTYKLSDDDNRLLNVTSEATGSMNEETLRATVEASRLDRTIFLGINFNRNYSTGDNQNFSPNPIDNVFMMSGYLYDGNQVTIQKEDDNVRIAEGANIIKLYRILAKNTLTIETEQGAGKFTPKLYRFHNVPKGGLLVPNVNIGAANQTPTDEYITTNREKYHMTADNSVESSYRLSTTNTEISFYYPENLQYSESEEIDAWEKRETNSYETGNKVFRNAPVNAAYIEIQGDYVDATGNISANVSYSLHLGNFGDTEKGGSLSDFNVIRNNNYTYKVTVNGVDDIIAEAQVESDDHNDNPYAEGLVISTTEGEHFEVDAHYEARVLTFTKASIQALKENNRGYILNVNTPFGNTKETVYVTDGGVYNMAGNFICSIDNAAQVFEREADYLWMRFVKNTTSNKVSTNISNADISKYPCKYPGDGHEKASDYGRWLNVFELLAELYKDATYTEKNGTEVYYSCFIDEYYYYNKAWKEYANQPRRTMQIANNLSISEDKKSIYAEVAYSISQRSISTFYTNENVKAFGTEIIDEEDVYNHRLGSSSQKLTYYDNIAISEQDDWNAWTSASATNTTTNNNNWYTHNNVVSNIEGIQPLYKAAAKACMSRNRDLNGNGIIDQNEVRWYLAAVDQYRAIYFAKNVLDVDAWLIHEDELTDINKAYTGTDYGRANTWNNGSDYNGHDYRGKYHYWTCSAKANAGTFWPEEGLTNNPAQTNWVSRAELVRCIRTLESGKTDEPKYGVNNPELYYDYDEDTRTFNLNGIKVNRQPTTSPLGAHNETGDLNELYTSFVVAANDLGTTHSLNNIINNSDYCLNYSETGYPAGTWRTPNQKEMALMLSKIPDLKSGNYGTRTKFTGSDVYSWHNSPGFGSENGSINLTNHNSAKIRCVRDVVPTTNAQ